MENLEKEIDCKVTVAFRNKLVCKKCNIFPRPKTEIMRCASCENILCGKCSGTKVIKAGTKCPLCQQFSNFIKQNEIMELLSGLKSYPCMNVKNGCLEEIPANGLNVHDQSCIYQKVPCPHCKEMVIFKDLGQHLKDVENDVEVYYGTETNKYTYVPEIFGIYKMQAELVNGRNHYKNEKYGIWWFGGNWIIGPGIGKGSGYAYVQENVKYPNEITGWNWKWYTGALQTTPTPALKGLGIRKGIASCKHSFI